MLDARQRLDHGADRRCGLRECIHKRSNGILIADVAKRLRRGRAQHWVAEERGDFRRNDRIVDADERLDRRKREIEIARLCDCGELVYRWGGRELAERLDCVETDIWIRVVERAKQRIRRLGMALRAE